MDSKNEAKAVSKWKCGNEFAPYHPQASHISPAYRDGWNDCYRATTDRLEALEREKQKMQLQIDLLYSDAKHHSDRRKVLEREKAELVAALKAANERAAHDYCCLSWDGKNVRGDKASIDAVRKAIQLAGNYPILQDMVRSLQDRLAAPGAADRKGQP